MDAEETFKVFESEKKVVGELKNALVPSQIPSADDVPRQFTVRLLRESSNDSAIFSSKVPLETGVC